MEIKQLIKEANYYDSIKEFKLADRIDKLIKISRDAKWEDLTDGNAIHQAFYVSAFQRFLNQHPECGCLNVASGPTIMQSVADAALQGQAAIDALTQQREQIGDTSCSQQVLEDCMAKLRGYAALDNPMTSQQVPAN